MKLALSVLTGTMIIILCGCDQDNDPNQGSNVNPSPTLRNDSINKVSASASAPRTESITGRLGLPDDYFPTAVGYTLGL